MQNFCVDLKAQRLNPSYRTNSAVLPLVWERGSTGHEKNMGGGPETAANIMKSKWGKKWKKKKIHEYQRRNEWMGGRGKDGKRREDLAFCRWRRNGNFHFTPAHISPPPTRTTVIDLRTRSSYTWSYTSLLLPFRNIQCNNNKKSALRLDESPTTSLNGVSQPDIGASLRGLKSLKARDHPSDIED
jgi:hypothetical protein